jgi:pimeloyl-ACP methyl ester carboxylesterase
MLKPKKSNGSTKRLHDCFLILYLDSLAYHLTLSYPRLFSKRYPTYFWIVVVPLTVLEELWRNVFVEKSWTRVGIILAIGTYLFVKLRPLVTISFIHAKAWAENRLEANSSAKTVIANGIKEGRILVEPDFFDLYLPPALQTQQAKDNFISVDKGLVFFPGALVEYQAYSGVSRRLSDEGMVVVLFDVERFHRLPIKLLGCDMSFVQRAIALLKSKYHIKVEEWSVGGHSLGGFTSQELVAEKPNFFRNAVLWANYRPLVLDDTFVNILVIQSTLDGVCESCRRDPERQQFLDSFARIRGRKKLHDIIGGNHSGFGDYAKQTFPSADKERTISLEEMHKEIVQVTSDFVFDRHSCNS